MGVISVQNHLPAFEFAGESSRDYGVYITDVNVFDGAARDIELVDIPGRNGAYIIDNGRFSDIAITYDCAMGADGSAGASDFAENMAAIRAWLSSVSGYARLEDDINPDEYRMAAFSGGIKVTTNGKRTGEFSIEFTAKPERYLKTGETAVTVTSGATITNPTKFSAVPLLMVDGYGDIEINEEKITITDTPIGRVEIGHENIATLDRTPTATVDIDTSMLNTGDAIDMEWQFSFGFRAAAGFDLSTGTLEPATDNNVAWNNSTQAVHLHSVTNTIYLRGVPFVYGTAKTVKVSANMYVADGEGDTESGYNAVLTLAYNGAARVTLQAAYNAIEYASLLELTYLRAQYLHIYGTSSKGSLGEPLYIDLEYGEAYKEESGEYVSVNNAVSLPAELPKLKPGENEITYTNHITELQMVPRWWTI